MRPSSHLMVPASAFTIIFSLFLLSLQLPSAFAQQNAQCGPGNPCYVGCCSSEGVCGFTDDHCGDGCQSNCDATAECGEYAPEGQEDCPLNVCCSEHGFCGVTEEFCGDGCQENSDGEGCGEAPSQSCDAEPDPFNLPVRAAYYELFTKGRPCGVKEPEDIPLEPLTHVHLSFVNFDDSFELSHEHSDWIKRMVHRKIEHPGVRMNIAIGGWAFNDPPTQHLFSDMANYYENRQTFVRSVVDFLRTYGLDGVDIDWEYPAAKDRGGIDDDMEAYVLLLSDLKDAFDAEGTDWEISIAVPSSYWYLRGFDLYALQDYVDYFNLMSYDIHGMWDLDNEWTGPYLKGHTDWRKIEEGLELLWRNAVRPEKVVMGFGFYGRSFTMESGGCSEPNGICQASDGGDPGTCTDTRGVLTFYEVASRNETDDVETFYDARNTVKYSIWGDQWISYDDQQSFHDKLVRLSENCLGGMMIWAIDQDTSDYDAMHALFGSFPLDGGKSDEELANEFEQYTGQNCMVTEKCFGGGSKDPDQECPSGYSGVRLAHNPVQTWPWPLGDDCEEGEHRTICCPSDAMPVGCEWNGAPERSAIGCTGSCSEGYYELNSDTFVDYEGTEPCYQGSMKLCCQSTKIIDDCYWTDCDGPFDSLESPDCKSGFDKITYRHDKPDGDGLCRETYGNNGSPHIEPFKSSLCCPSERSFDNCNWANNPDMALEKPPPISGPETWCRIPRPCRDDQIKIADATYPEVVAKLGWKGADKCDSLSLPSGYDNRINLCCDPQDIWGEEDWPVDPEHLWDEEWDDPKTDGALWQYESHHTNNDKDDTRDGSHDIDGEDSFGFMMLNGPDEMLDDHFGETHTVIRKQAEIPKVKREIFTTDRKKLESVFDHSEETFYVYCNHKSDSKECNHVWLGRVEDTIIRLPTHVGEGPFARIVSMKAAKDFKLPEHHLKHRSEDGIHDNEVYEVKVDYAFSEINADDGHINIRVDYTNLMEYWDEIVDAPAKRSRIKRGLPEVTEDGPFGLRHFRDRVKRAHVAEQANPNRKRAEPIKATMPVRFEGDEDLDSSHSSVYDSVRSDLSPAEVHQNGHIAKRWWGAFKDWLKKSTTVSDGSKGDLPMGLAKRITLFRQSWGCAGKGYRANLRMDLEAEFSMQATYAYYYSGTFVPPSKPDVFFYFGVEPEAYVGLDIKGNVRLNATSHKTKIIDTLSYPGLAIKGIAAVGPTLDLYGQVSGYLNIQGQAKAGAKVSFGRAEAYWPQDEAALEDYDNILGLDLKEDPDTPSAGEVTPVFDAGVKVEAGLDVIVQPEAHVGIQVGGGKWSAGVTIIDAQLTSFVKGILHFFAEMRSTSTPSRWDYTYGVYLYYNIGYDAKARVLEWADWALGQRMAYKPDRRVEIYTKDGSIDLSSSGTRSIPGRMATLDADNRTSKADNFTILNYDDPGAFRMLADSDDSDDQDTPALSDAKTHAVCPDGGAPALRLPEMRFNCGAFPPIQVENQDPNSPVNKITLPGLCDGYKLAGADGRTLTHAPEISRNSRLAVNTRRRAQCPPKTKTRKGVCEPINDSLKEAFDSTNTNPAATECDEFPWGASEEGGNWLNAGDRSRVCVPSVQNGIGGQCIRMLGHMMSNVGKMEPSIENIEDRPDHWVKWIDVDRSDGDRDDSFWESDKTEDLGDGVEVVQRLTKYSDTEEQPTPAGKNYQTWRKTQDNKYKSWVFKRNYTFSLTDNGINEDSFWGATDNVFSKPSYEPRFNDNNNIICALNIFDQFDYYLEPHTGTWESPGSDYFNGYCFRNDQATRNGWPGQWATAQCRVFFGASVNDVSTADKIRRDGGSVWNGWEVKHIEYLDDVDFDEDPDSGLYDELLQEHEDNHLVRPTDKDVVDDPKLEAAVTQRQHTESLFDGVSDDKPSTSASIAVESDVAGDLAALAMDHDEKIAP